RGHLRERFRAGARVTPLRRGQPVQAEPRRDRVEPRRELGVAPEFSDRPMDAEEDLLSDVLGLGRVTQHPHRHAEHAMLIGSYELFEGAWVTGAQPLDEARRVRSALSHY